MSDNKDAVVQEFLERLAGLMGEQVALPDFEDLFLLDPSGDGGVVQVTPDDIEAFIVMGQQKAEMARLQAEEEIRLEGQRKTTDAVRDRLDKLPDQPSPQALLIVPPDALPDIAGLTEEADKAYRKLERVRGTRDEAFEVAAGEAETAIDARDEAIRKAHDAVEAEVKRRGAAVKELEATAGKHKASIFPEVAKLVAEKAARPPSVVRLTKALAELEVALKAAEDDREQATPDRFDSRVEEARKQLDELPATIGKTRTTGEQKRGENRDEVLKDLRSPGRLPTPGQLEMLAGSNLVATWSNQSAAHDKNHSALTGLVKAEPDAFEAQRKVTEDGYRAARTTLDALMGAVRTETSRRTAEADRLEKARTGIPVPTLLNGTDEKKSYTEASDEALRTWRVANALLGSKAATLFDSAAKEAQGAVDRLAGVAAAAEVAAKGRRERLSVRKKEVATLYEEARTSFVPVKASPIAGLPVAISEAFVAGSKDLSKQIDGADEDADEKALAALRVHVGDTKALIAAAVARLKPVDVDPVKNNVEIKTKAEALLKALQSGIGPTAIGLIDQIDLEVGKIADRYREIEALRSRYDEAIEDKSILPEQQKIIRRFPDLEQKKDGYNKGELTTETTTFRNAIILIEKAVESKNATAEYLTSPAYTFMQLMESGDNTTMAQLQQLVTAGTAVRGVISDAYRSSYDKPDAFSVEITLPIGGRPGVVIHAHCEPGGQPKPANGCHVKLFRYRFDPGGIQLANPLRAPLLHSNNDHRSRAETKGLV